MKKGLIFDLFIISLLVLIDQFTKLFVQMTMKVGQSITVIKGFFDITYARNTGAAFSMMEGKMNFFYIITIVALIVMFFMLNKTSKRDFWTNMALILMISGTIGNFIDRLYFRYVRDFLDFVIFGYDFAIFNLADAFLCIGVFCLLIEYILDR